MSAESITLSKLYKKTSTGVIQEWQIEAVNLTIQSVIITKFGQVGGKIQSSRETVNEGKNIGKANATTHYQQAELQARATHQKQLKKGYVTSIEDAQAGKVDNIIEGGIVPMLAHKFSEQGHKIVYPALVQPKLDGCVSSETIINTNIGDITIGDIVNNNIDCLVKTFNQETNKTEFKPVLNRTKNGLNINVIGISNILAHDKNHKKWFEIETDDGRKLKITGNHLVYLPRLKCWRRVDELKIDDKILNFF
jgi:hypothetical protein